jgi:hypothetical protein
VLNFLRISAFLCGPSSSDKGHRASLNIPLGRDQQCRLNRRRDGYARMPA